ncbi:hypothetical protein PRUPE_7G059900 [Prunus persica]|uniref:Uncharacterized protein n=1 Tax=Prunus persica TaxID=3760 RepID=A0A251N7G5_PRUPE|nr:hypothetical protein PRUPE_7G059900 [Prunus persica]
MHEFPKFNIELNPHCGVHRRRMDQNSVEIMQDRGNELIGPFHFPTHPHLKLGRHGATEQYDPGFGIVQSQQVNYSLR